MKKSEVRSQKSGEETGESTLKQRIDATIAVFLLAAVVCLLTPAVFAGSTIDINNPYAYGANIGWINARADGGTNGAVIGEFFCSGYLYAANAGWISLGNTNGPANGYSYSNLGADYGVNTVGGGQLSGLAYGANIGWIQFEQTYGQPRVDLLTGNLTGYAYAANCGWISLSNVQAFVQTDSLAAGLDTDGDGIPDAWEMKYAGNLTLMNASTDTDGDGVKDIDEYRADTNPLDSKDYLRVTVISANNGGSTNALTWTSKATRVYQVQERLDLATGTWGTNTTLGLILPDPGVTTSRTATESAAPRRFFRVQAIKPLSP